ncbi:MAG: dethiobiotin synthase [Nocardioidaceae bacterium]|nr:dethiobiotin synthase [Nocardioidaceae bacterium]
MRFLAITGTSTGVGKTIVTAVIARRSLELGLDVCVIKPAQTGASPEREAGDGDPPDIATIARLSGCAHVHQLVTLADPLAPDTAARLRGLSLPTVHALSRQVTDLAADHDVVLIEGSGGVAVRLDTAGGTLSDMATHLVAAGHQVRFVVVTSLALGTLNHTELTVQSLAAAGQAVAGLVLGDVPAELGLAEQCNLDELPRVTGLTVLGAIPHGVGDWEPARFQRVCNTWLSVDSLLTNSTAAARPSPAPEPPQL